MFGSQIKKTYLLYFSLIITPHLIPLFTIGIRNPLTSRNKRSSLPIRKKLETNKKKAFLSKMMKTNKRQLKQRKLFRLLKVCLCLMLVLLIARMIH